MTENKSGAQKNCPVCNSPNWVPFIEIKDVPIFCNQLFQTHKEATQTLKGSINLSFCKKCGHVFNSVFNSDLMTYSQAYENSLHFSPRFQDYAESLAKKLIRKYDLIEKKIIEIGCGKGDFLNMLCEYGNNRGVGFDPSFEQDRFEIDENARFKVIQDIYSEKYIDQKAELICCRHVLEHIEYPRDFLKSVRRTVDQNYDAIVFFEVPNVMFTLKDLGIWDLIYEHCSYFSQSSLKYIFQFCGFDIIGQEETFESQFLCIESKPGRVRNSDIAVFDKEIENMSAYVSAFNNAYTTKVLKWQKNLEEMTVAKQKAVVWGAGSKGVTFLNVLKIEKQVAYIVDINPHKQGLYVAGTGQKVVSPEYLKDFKPDIIIMMNPIYEDEIRKIASENNIHCTFKSI